MTQGLLNLPFNVPWKLIATSADMMDTNFCNKKFPVLWRPCLAISVFEPDVDSLPEEMCDERLTYVKVTATITGYQPTREETQEAHTSFPSVPVEKIDQILDNYFACYGVLLTVAVFPLDGFIRDLQPMTVSFGNQAVGTVLPNPFHSDDFTFRGPENGGNRVVNLSAAAGGAQLAIRGSLVVTFPASAKVQASVVRRGSTVVTMEVFAGGVLIDTQTATPSLGEIQRLQSIERDGIDQIILRCSEGEASLLEVTAFVARQTPVSLDRYPHIVSFEPKVRDLYQAATDTGEVLTTSKSGVHTDKTLTHVDSTESGFDYGVKVPVPIAPGINAEVSGNVHRKTTDTDEDRWTVQTDASRERRETQGTTTQLSQMYNLLTGYYAGTNRATFLLLPRPHVLQPTDHRTFVQGLRVIEGIQEFMLVVSRPKGMSGLCIEASLETGHFPEGEDPIEPPVEYEESFEEFTVTAHASGSRIWQNECKKIESVTGSKYTIGLGWVIDRRTNRKDGQEADSGHPGVQEIANNSNGQANNTLKDYNYQTLDDTTVQVSGEICGKRWSWDRIAADFKRTYRVLTRSAQPKPSRGEPHVPVADLIITSRGLCVCIRSGKVCPEVIPHDPTPPDVLGESIVDERPLSMSRAALSAIPVGGSRTPALKEFISRMHAAMVTSWRQPRRYPAGEIGFLDSDFFKKRVRRALDPPQLQKPLAAVEGLPDSVVRSLGATSSVGDALDLDLPTFARRTGLPVGEAARVRSKLLGSQ